MSYLVVVRYPGVDTKYKLCFCRDAPELERVKTGNHLYLNVPCKIEHWHVLIDELEDIVNGVANIPIYPLIEKICKLLTELEYPESTPNSPRIPQDNSSVNRLPVEIVHKPILAQPPVKAYPKITTNPNVTKPMVLKPTGSKKKIVSKSLKTPPNPALTTKAEEFINSRIRTDSKAQYTIFYNQYRNYISGGPGLNKIQFERLLLSKGYKKTRLGNKSFWNGVFTM